MGTAVKNLNRRFSLARAIDDLDQKGIEVASLGPAYAPLACPQRDAFQVIEGASGADLGTVQIPDDADGSVLMRQVQQFLRSPKAELLALKRAHDAFEAERKDLISRFGIDVGEPVDLAPMGESFGRQLLFPMTYLCDQYGRPVGEPDGASVGEYLKIKLASYVPGRERYPSSSLYQAGEIATALFKNAANYAAIRTRAELNVVNCGPSSNRDFWIDVLETLTRGNI
jgi:hypothetical protein